MATLATFPMHGNLQTEPFKAKALTLSGVGGAYVVIAYTSVSRDENTKSGAAYGWYDFVVLPESPAVCWVCRTYGDRAVKYGPKWAEKSDGVPRLKPGSTRGHSSIAQGREVLWAGKLRFTGGPISSSGEARGNLSQWCNSSGHYMRSTSNQSEERTKNLAEMQTAKLLAADGTRMLPMDRFRPWDGDF